MNFIFLRIRSFDLVVYKYPHKWLLFIFRNITVFLSQQQLLVYFFHITQNCLKALQLAPSSPITTQTDRKLDLCKQQTRYLYSYKDLKRKNFLKNTSQTGM